METTSDCGRPFKARVGYFLWKNEFIKTKIKLRQEAMYLVWTSVCVLHKVDYIIKAWQKIIKARSFTTHFKEEEIKGYMWEEILRSRQQTEGKEGGQMSVQSEENT